VTITTDYTAHGNKNVIAMSYPKLAHDLKPGSAILCADGSIVMEVVSTNPAAGTVVARCKNTAMLGWVTLCGGFWGGGVCYGDGRGAVGNGLLFERGGCGGGGGRLDVESGECVQPGRAADADCNTPPLHTPHISERKNVNLPGVVVDLPTLTEKDVDDLVGGGGDWDDDADWDVEWMQLLRASCASYDCAGKEAAACFG